MYQQFSLTPGYAGHNWVLSPFYSLPQDLLYPPGMLLRDSHTNNPPVLLSMVTEPAPLTLQFPPEVVSPVRIGQQQQHQGVQQKPQHFQQQQPLIPSQQQFLKFRQRLHRPIMHPKLRANLHRFKKTSPIRCDVCNVNLNSRLQASQHFNGKNHLRIVNKLEKSRNETAASERSLDSCADTNNETNGGLAKGSCNETHSTDSEGELFKLEGLTEENIRENASVSADPTVTKEQQTSLLTPETTTPATTTNPPTTLTTHTYPSTSPYPPSTSPQPPSTSPHPPSTSPHPPSTSPHLPSTSLHPPSTSPQPLSNSSFPKPDADSTMNGDGDGE